MAKVNMASLNEDPPPVNTGLMRWGVGVDGVGFYVSVHLEPNTTICSECEGEGKIHYNAGVDGFEKWRTRECECCNGDGVVYSETENDDEA
jgi:hypothetical protein